MSAQLPVLSAQISRLSEALLPADSAALSAQRSAPSAQPAIGSRPGIGPITIKAQESISVPRAQAQLINDSLVRAAKASEHMRAALETSIKVLRGEEALLHIAQTQLSALPSNK